MRIKLIALLMAIVLVVIPITQADGLEVSVTSEDRLTSGIDTQESIKSEASLKVTSKSNDSASVDIRTKIKAELESKNQGPKTVKESIDQRKKLLDDLKQRLLETNPNERNEITKEINSARLQGLIEIKSLVKSSSDIKEFEKEKLDLGLELCNQLTQENEKCLKETNERKEKLEKLTEQELQTLKNVVENSVASRAKTQSIANSDGMEKFKVVLKEDASGAIGFDIKAREIPETRIAEAEKKIEGLNVSGLALKVQASKEGFFKIKQQADSCDKNTVECQKAKEELNKKAKEFVLNALDSLIAKLEKIKLVIDAETSITDQESLEKTQEVEKIISKLKEIRVKTEASGDLDIKLKIREVNKELREIQPETEKISGFVQTSRMGGILVKSAKLSEKLNRVLEKMALEKIDVSVSAKIVAEINAELDLLKTDFEVVQEKFRQAANKTAEERNSLIKEAQEKQKSFKEKLNTLNDKIQDILKNLKETGSLKHLQESKVDVVLESQSKAIAGIEQ